MQVTAKIGRSSAGPTLQVGTAPQTRHCTDLNNSIADLSCNLPCQITTSRTSVNRAKYGYNQIDGLMLAIHTLVYFFSSECRLKKKKKKNPADLSIHAKLHGVDGRIPLLGYYIHLIGCSCRSAKNMPGGWQGHSLSEFQRVHRLLDENHFMYGQL